LAAAFFFGAFFAGAFSALDFAAAFPAVFALAFLSAFAPVFLAVFALTFLSAFVSWPADSPDSTSSMMDIDAASPGRIPSFTMRV